MDNKDMNEKEKLDTQAQGIILVEGDDMQISIVRTDDNKADQRRGLSRKWRTAVVSLACASALLIAATGWIVYERFADIGVPVSRSPQENIALLQQMMTTEPQGAKGIAPMSDSVLGVAMDFYSVSGLRASLQNTEPTEADTDVCLYVRSADYMADGTLIGATVVEGEEHGNTSDQRHGYAGMIDHALVIGVSRSDAVKDFVKEHHGSFFRQFVMVSNGVLPSRFSLHGKVERRALGRIGNEMYVVCTRHKETMWDFADAMREYGFEDAIYITGGLGRTFYRDTEGTTHPFGTDTTHRDGIPWLVFRK